MPVYTERQHQRCYDPSDTALIENNAVAPKWVAAICNAFNQSGHCIVHADDQCNNAKPGLNNAKVTLLHDIILNILTPRDFRDSAGHIWMECTLHMGIFIRFLFLPLKICYNWPTRF